MVAVDDPVFCTAHQAGHIGYKPGGAQ